MFLLFMISARSRAPSNDYSWSRRAPARRATTASSPHTCSLVALSRDLQQGPVAAEPCAERRHPPVSAGRLFVERGLQHEVDARAADVAVVAQNRRTPSRVGLRQAHTLANGSQNFPAAGVKDPSRDPV